MLPLQRERERDMLFKGLSLPASPTLKPPLVPQLYGKKQSNATLTPNMRLRHPRDPYILSRTHVALAYHNIDDDPIHSMVNWRHDDHVITTAAAIPSLIPSALNTYDTNI